MLDQTRQWWAFIRGVDTVVRQQRLAGLSTGNVQTMGKGLAMPVSAGEFIAEFTF
jgi:hypothetical protein